MSGSLIIGPSITHFIWGLKSVENDHMKIKKNPDVGRSLLGPTKKILWLWEPPVCNKISTFKKHCQLMTSPIKWRYKALLIPDKTLMFIFPVQVSKFDIVPSWFFLRLPGASWHLLKLSVTFRSFIKLPFFSCFLTPPDNFFCFLYKRLPKHQNHNSKKKLLWLWEPPAYNKISTIKKHCQLITMLIKGC